MLTPEFKTCPMCQTHWLSREDFLGDRLLVFNGYQANFGAIEEGLFYFTHEMDGCGTTMALRAESFFSLYSGEKYTESKHLLEECQGYCLHKNETRRCQANCRYAFVREISQMLMDRQAEASPSIVDTSNLAEPRFGDGLN